MNWENILEEFNFKQTTNHNTYNPYGQTYYIDNDSFKGCYWFYETDEFIIDIHNLFVKKNYFANEMYMPPCVKLISNYIISGDGMWHFYDRKIKANTALLTTSKNLSQKHSLTANSIFHSTGIKFKEQILSKYDITGIGEGLIVDSFYKKKDHLLQYFKRSSKEICAYNNNRISSKLFFEAKAKEWLCNIIEDCRNLEQKEDVLISDVAAIEKVAEYINNNYNKDITQEHLKDIALMCSTKLKKTFKNRFNLTITEYIQRKRINESMKFLVNCDMNIHCIAKKVGYSSPGRFSTIFKRYNGINPSTYRDLKRV